VTSLSMKRFLAVTHTASVTGAPMNLIHLLRWIRDHTGIEVHTLVLEDGPLVPRFAECGGVTVIDRHTTAKLLSLAERGLNRMGAASVEGVVASARLAPQLRGLDGFDVAYLNSATSIRIARHLPAVGLRVSHVHELEVALRTMEPPDHDALCTYPDAWIAASQPVSDFLVGEMALPADRVLLHEEFIAAHALSERTVSVREVEACRRQIPELPTAAAVVVGCGTLDWRKGPDLFIQLACEVRRRDRRPVHFVWIGGEHRGAEWERVRSDRDRAGADHVHFLPTVADPAPWFATADVFALTSREDPLPLVCLECGVLGTPVVTYRNGGIPGLLQRSGPAAAAGIVDHLDVNAMADRILALLHSDELRAAAGDQLRRRILGNHDVYNAAPRLVADLDAMLRRVAAGEDDAASKQPA
jgi:glycosyltransferase involved in cell wall biosynthesis